MSVHDAYARRTPFELVFPDPAEADRNLMAIADEAAARGGDLSRPSSLAMLMAAGRMLRELKGDGDAPERIHEHGALLFHLFHHWRADCATYLLDLHASRFLVEAAPEADTTTVPESAAYVQLPQHLFWVGAGEAAPPESIDGFHWSTTEAGAYVLLVLGLRPDRPGYSVVPMGPLDLSEAPDWGRATMRDDGPDFESSLPGAELDRLYEIRTMGEALKLVGRALPMLASNASQPTTAPDAEPASGPPRSRFPYRRVGL